jgi:hypothetical protein
MTTPGAHSDPPVTASAAIAAMLRSILSPAQGKPF